MTPMTSSLSQRLADLVGVDAVLPQEELAEHAIDGVVPEAAVAPPDRRAVAEIMAWASEQRVSVFPRGGGTQWALGNVPDSVGIVLDLSRQTRVLDYQPADLTATVEAGVTLHRAQRELAPGGKFLPLESPVAERSTIGGILAANSTGPLRHTYGQPRDWLIGIAVVGADGVETKAGGKVVKNVTGYDLNKLYTGSLGTLGIIVEATFKLSPLQMDRGTVVAGFPSLREGIIAGAGLLQQVFAPQAIQIVDGQVVRRLTENGISGAGPLGNTDAGSALALAFFSGRPRAVKRRMEESTRLLSASGASEVAGLDEAQGHPLLKGLTDLGWSEDTRPYLGIKVTVPPSSMAGIVSECHRQDAPFGFSPGVVADPGFGSVRLLWWAEPVRDVIEDSVVLETIVRTRKQAREVGGSAVVEHCPLALKKQIDVWGEQPQGLEIMRRIKQEFDPLGILSPGRFVGKI